jgi:hypothetical protein
MGNEFFSVWCARAIERIFNFVTCISNCLVQLTSLLRTVVNILEAIGSALSQHHSNGHHCHTCDRSFSDRHAASQHRDAL